MKKCLIVLMLMLTPLNAFGQGCGEQVRNVTLPYSLNFDTDEWVEDIACNDCGGTSTHTTSGCYSGGCMKVLPPTSGCASGNGGGVGIGWITYSAQSEVHVRFLIKFGPTFYANKMTSGLTKFLLFDWGGRSGIMGLIGKSEGYMAWAVADIDTGVYHFDLDDAWPDCYDVAEGIRMNDTLLNGVWIAVEYYVSNARNETGIYLWTQDGALTGGPYIRWSWPIAIDNEGFYISYYNDYGTADAGNYYLMDNIVVSSSYIGPPDGFLAGSSKKTLFRH